MLTFFSVATLEAVQRYYPVPVVWSGTFIFKMVVMLQIMWVF